MIAARLAPQVSQGLCSAMAAMGASFLGKAYS
jgi:hypothetical protein